MLRQETTVALGVLFLLGSVWSGCTMAHAEPAIEKNPLNLGSRRELFVDRLLIDRLDNTHLKLHEPVSGGVAIEIDKPWE